MKKQLLSAASLLIAVWFAVPAMAASGAPHFWGEIKDGGRRIEILANSAYDSNFRCDLNVRFEIADGTPGNFLCEAKVYGKSRKALVCADRTKGARYTAVGKIRQFCSLD